MSQSNLFGDDQIPDQHLIIKKQSTQKLTKKQREFNKLIKELELQRELSEITLGLLDKGLQNYTNYIFPIIEEKKEVLKLLIIRLQRASKENRSKLTRFEKDILPEIISAQLEHLFSIAEEYTKDDVLKQIFEEVNGYSIDEENEDKFDILKEEVEDMLDEMGIDMDLSKMRADSSDEQKAEFIAALKEKLKGAQNKDQYKGKAHHHGHQHRGRPGNIKNEEKLKALEEAKSKDIHTIYKQLAKILHPDIEMDEGLKAEKQDLMQKVIEAYQNKDLHTLLKLELQFINKESQNMNALTEEKLSIYNEILKEQLIEEKQKISILTQNPKYRFNNFYLAQGFHLHSEWMKVKKMEENWIIQMKRDIDILKSFSAAKRLKEIVKEYEQELNSMDTNEEMISWKY